MCILTKAEQRAEIKKRIENISYFDRSFKSHLICDDIIKSRLIDNHNHILLYRALPTEVNIDWLIEFACIKGKACFFPRVNGDKLEMVKYPCKFQKGAYGVIEPIGEAVDCFIDLCIVPVMGLDNEGNRLGKGKGYYDRFFESHPNCSKVAVAFREQVLDKIVTEEHDIKMDKMFVR